MRYRSRAPGWAERTAHFELKPATVALRCGWRIRFAEKTRSSAPQGVVKIGPVDDWGDTNAHRLARTTKLMAEPSVFRDQVAPLVRETLVMGLMRRPAFFAGVRPQRRRCLVAERRPAGAGEGASGTWHHVLSDFLRYSDNRFARPAPLPLGFAVLVSSPELFLPGQVLWKLVRNSRADAVPRLARTRLA